MPKFPLPFELFWQIWALIPSIDTVGLGQVQLSNRSSESNRNFTHGVEVTKWPTVLFKLSIWMKPSLGKFFSFPTTGRRILIQEQGCWVKAGITLHSLKRSLNQVCKLSVVGRQPRANWCGEKEGDNKIMLHPLKSSKFRLTMRTVALLSLQPHFPFKCSTLKILAFQYNVI